MGFSGFAGDSGPAFPGGCGLTGVGTSSGAVPGPTFGRSGGVVSGGKPALDSSGVPAFGSSWLGGSGAVPFAGFVSVCLVSAFDGSVFGGSVFGGSVFGGSVFGVVVFGGSVFGGDCLGFSSGVTSMSGYSLAGALGFTEVSAFGGVTAACVFAGAGAAFQGVHQHR